MQLTNPGFVTTGTNTYQQLLFFFYSKAFMIKTSLKIAVIFICNIYSKFRIMAI